MKSSITSYAIAQALGISQSTVSRALNGSTLISDSVKEKVLRKAREMGYIFNYSAKSLVMGKSGAVGLLASGFQNDITGAKIIAIDNEIRKNALHPHIAYTKGEPELTLTKAIELIERGVDGLILLNSSMIDRQNWNLCEKLLKFQVPLVMISDSELSFKCGQVLQSCEKSYKENISYLLKNNCDDILILWKNESLAKSLKDIRFKTITSVLKEYSRYRDDCVIPVAESVFHPTLTQDAAEVISRQSEKIKNILIKRYTGSRLGIICHNDMLAAEVLSIALALQIKIPESLMISGYGNSSVSIYATPQITTISPDPQELARSVFEVLNELMSEKSNKNIIKTVQHKFLPRNT